MRGGVIEARYLGGRPGPQVVQAHGAADSFAVDPVRLGLSRGGGQPLPDPVRAKMEAAFGTDFSRVRVHVGPQASRIGAIAFTMGHDIYFAPGQYRPETIQGQQLLGHELAHVVQQRQGRVKMPASGVAVVQDRMLEAEADRLGMRAALQRMPARPNVQLRWPHSAHLPPFAHPVQRAQAKKPQRSASVVLTIGPNDYSGASSGQYGHAEMEALRKYIITFDSVEAAAADFSRRRKKLVECHNQPVCVACSHVLQALGFSEADDETEFGSEKSGGVSWNGNLKVAEFMEAMELSHVYEEAKRKGAK